MSELFVMPHAAVDVSALCVQVHRYGTGNILNLVMVKAGEGTMLKVDLPVEFKGEDACPGLKKGITFFLFFFFSILVCYAQHTSVHDKGI
jgi:large subunit ribosomal protein L25